ncbi:MAG: DUF192 domain-containing protein [Patescibacteria group bacterium]
MKIRTAVISSILALALVALATYLLTAPRTGPGEDARTFTQVTQDPDEPSGSSSQASFDFEVVASEEARAQGLSGRTSVPPGYGMLFVFDAPERYGFWMKDMLVSIDIIWLADDGTILAIEENVSPSTYPTPFYPPQPVRLVLETRPGEAAAQGWSVGSRIPLPL